VNELDYILGKYAVDTSRKPPYWIRITRNDLAQLFHELDYEVGVELGVERGLYTEVLCRENPQALIYGIDPWDKYPGYRDHVSQNKLDRFFKETMQRLAPYENAMFLRSYSIDAVQEFADGELDFVYIDANHDFLHIAQDLCWWSKKVRPGGIVSGHDYQRKKGRYRCDVKDVVQAFMFAHEINPWFVVNDHGKSPSWFYVKGE
jgi:hypothetical protein